MKLFKRKKGIAPRRRLSISSDENSSGSIPVYRRNQTLSGVDQSLSPRTKTHHLSIKRRKVFGLLMIVLLFAIIVWLLICNFTATVAIKVSGNLVAKNIDNLAYEKVIQDYFAINPIGRFKFFLDQSSLKSFIVSKMPEVGAVRQGDSIGLGVTEFNISMRNPVAGWIIDGKQYFVDADGESFDKNYFDIPAVQIVDQSGASLQSGSTVVSQRFLGFVGRVVSQARNKGYDISQAVLPPYTTRELDIRTKDGDYLVKLSIDRPVGEQVEDMAVALKHFTDIGRKPEYVDVRVSGKAFYK